MVWVIGRQLDGGQFICRKRLGNRKWTMGFTDLELRKEALLRLAFPPIISVEHDLWIVRKVVVRLPLRDLFAPLRTVSGAGAFVTNQPASRRAVGSGL
jgi:hypothetical protein